ncbi:MAG: response regulator transcription factor [Lachnospiraceae bacterium]|nr:response regulator transcription factor [Lachnospiraceae bacterium]
MVNKYKILIVDDDTDLSMLICDMLSDNGYDYMTAKSLDDAYEILEHENVHLILLDINLPDGTGFELCQELRRVSEIPVIFASARTSENDKVKGLDMGGDDYIAKPYSIKELMSRINSLIRRTYGFKGKNSNYTLQAGKDNVIEIDTGSHTVKRVTGEKSSTISLSLKEYDLLLYLCEHNSQAVSKEELVNAVWGAFSDVEPSTLTVHIRWLREKLENNPSKPVFIKTVWGVGYILEETTE